MAEILKKEPRSMTAERKRAEEALKISEEKWRSLVENAPDVIMEVSRDGKIRNINRVVAGLSVEQVIGKNVADFMPPDQKGRVMDAIKKVFKTGEPTSYEVAGVGPQGSTAHYSTSIGPIVRGGRVDSTLHVTRDFTERKQMEEDLHRSEEKFRLVFESTKEGIVFINNLGKVTEVNQAMLNIIGFERGQLIGKNIAQLVPGLKMDVRAILSAFKGILSGKLMGEHDWSLTNKKGRNVVIRARYSPVKKEGKIIGISAIVEDITERRRAEDALKENEERYRLILEASDAGVSLLDRNGVFIVANTRAAATWHKKPSEIIGKSLLQVLSPPEFANECMATLRRVIKTGRSVKREVFVASLNKHIIEDGRPVRDRNGELIGVQVMTFDITERKRAEDAVQIVNQCFMNFGPDPIKNLNLITQAVGQVLEAVCVLYNRKEGEMLVTLAGWQIPPDMKKVDRGKGHICFDVIEKGGEKPIVIRDLQHTKYAKTDPNVKKYDLQTYVSCPVRIGKEAVASLCAVYQKDLELSGLQLRILQMLSKAASVEEGRRRAEKMLREQKVTLEQKNIALREIVAQIEVEKNKIKDDISANVDEILLPSLKKLRIKGASRKYVEVLRRNLEGLTSSFGQKISDKRFKLTPREIEICDMIRNGLSSKEISGLLGVSHQTIEKHRKNIREKLRIANKGINLAAFLQQL